ncbi:MAG: TusE/DsrC/DsvC family sulfur relay protein [Acidimicrobiales bacterium]
MPVASYGGKSVQVNDEGFLVDAAEWSEEMAGHIAMTIGLAPLNHEQMHVVKVMRSEYEANGDGPNVRALGKASGVPIKRLYELFPMGPAKTAAKIAGIPKPRGCI